MDKKWTRKPTAVVGEAAIMRDALERLAKQGQPVAIRALAEIDGRSPYVQSQRELWAAQGVYGHKPAPTRKRKLPADPVDPEYERWARKEFGWALREAWRTIWAELGAPITVVRVGGAGRG